MFLEFVTLYCFFSEFMIFFNSRSFNSMMFLRCLNILKTMIFYFTTIFKVEKKLVAALFHAFPKPGSTGGWEPEFEGPSKPCAKHHHR